MQSRLSPADLQALIAAARGRRKCDTVVRGGHVLNVFTGETTRHNIGIVGKYIAVVDGGDAEIEADRVIEADNLFLVPGFIDGHVHLESSLLTPAEFARMVLPLGTTAVVIDAHEIANVAGTEGIRELMRVSEGLPLTFYFMIPPCVSASELDTSGARLDASDMAEFAGSAHVLGVGEAMDYRGILDGREEALEKLMSIPHGVIDGHAPHLTGRDLQAYAAAGITSDHESTNPWEALEKLRAGMYVMIREGSAARNLDDLARLVNPHTGDRCLLVTDDLLPTDLEERGHLNYLLSRMVHRGVGPAQAVRMATFNAARRFGIGRAGAIAPGYAADIAVLEDLSDFRAALVIAKGQLAAADGELVLPIHVRRFSRDLAHTVHLPDLQLEDLAIPAGDGEARVIEAIEGQIVTRQLTVRPAILAGRVAADIENDILKIAVVERHGKSGRVGLGLIKGFNLKAGAIAGSVSHDSHNVVAVGAGDRDILLAVEHIGEMNGGLAAVAGGKVVSDLPLPIGGLMSRRSGPVVANELRRLEGAARELGCSMAHPFMTLSFMCLSVVPELKLTASGLVDVERLTIVPLFVGERGKVELAAAG